MRQVNTSYPPETAGRLMTERVPVARESETIKDVEGLLIKESSNFDTINYIYVVDGQKKLKGVLSVKEIFCTPKESPVKSLLAGEVVSVRPHTDQQRAALLALTHNIKAMPVVDKDGVFLGAVAADDILKILDSEAVEDILRFGGVYPGLQNLDNPLSIPIFTALKHRLPWLLVGLLGGMAAAAIIGSFENVLAQSILVAAFIPLIVYIAGASAVQTETFIIRDLAVNPKIDFFKYFARQFTVVAFIGVVSAAFLYFLSLFFYGNFEMSLVLSSALFLAVLSSVITGLLVPFAFQKMNMDPANASGPIATIIQDILSVVIYLVVASALLL